MSDPSNVDFSDPQRTIEAKPQHKQRSFLEELEP